MEKVTDIRVARAKKKSKDRADQIAKAKELKAKGYSNVQASIEMGISESSFRSLL